MFVEGLGTEQPITVGHVKVVARRLEMDQFWQQTMNMSLVGLESAAGELACGTEGTTKISPCQWNVACVIMKFFP